MSGTDVAHDEVAERVGEEPDVRRKSAMLSFLKVWLPFPVILGAILVYQFRSGLLERPPVVKDEESGIVFEGAGADLPLLLQSLQEERTRLQKEWSDVREAKSRLLLETGEIEQRQREVDELLARVESRVQGMEAEQDRMLAQLARVYDTMKPDAAAEILAGVDVDTSTEILRRMKERAAAQVMASLDPKSAARISQRMLRTP